MKNKYKIFVEAIEDLKLDSSIRQCKSLIRLGQNYYSLYKQFKHLENIPRKLSNIYKIPNSSESKSKIILVKGALDIRYLLFIEFYFDLIKAWDDSTPVEIDWILDYQVEVPDLIQKYRLKNERIGDCSLEKWIMKSCSQMEKILVVSNYNHQINLGLDNIRKVIRVFNRYKNIKLISEEESFNALFSEKFVNYLLKAMKYENILCVYIAPIRLQLCKQEQGGRTINNKTWKWCYEKDYRFSLSELEHRIQNIKKLDPIFSQFNDISKQLNLIKKSMSL